MSYIHLLVGFLAGFLGAIGVGGGSGLMIYLTLFLQTPQLKAQGINLVFFLPCALVGILFHIKNKLIDFRKAIPFILCGIAGVLIGAFMHRWVSGEILSKVFGAFIIVIALLQILSVIKAHKQNKNY